MAGNFYVIRAFARPSRVLLYLLVGAKTGNVRFIARYVRSRQVEKIDLPLVATADVLAEISEKSAWNIRYGYALQTVMVSAETKQFINDCWEKLKMLKPGFCIR